jgi:hypothetical protein
MYHGSKVSKRYSVIEGLFQLRRPISDTVQRVDKASKLALSMASLASRIALALSDAAATGSAGREDDAAGSAFPANIAGCRCVGGRGSDNKGAAADAVAPAADGVKPAAKASA